MTATVRPILVTRDIDRLRRFYSSLFGADEPVRFPDDGPVVSVGLQVGDSELGLSADDKVVVGEPGRVLLSIDVPDVDAMLPEVDGLGGRVHGPANDMPWGQRVAHIADPDGNAVNLTQQL